MKYLFISLLAGMYLLTLCNSSAYADTEKELYKAAAGKMQSFYNQNKHDSIFYLFASAMQEALPLQKTTEFFSGLKTEAGLLQERTFERNQSSYAVYRAKFERGLFILNISVDNDGKINGFFVKPVEVQDTLSAHTRNTTAMMLPFRHVWKAIWGGDTKEMNYHVESVAQKGAFDFMATDTQGNTYKTDGKTNADYYSFGEEILAPCNGEIVLAVDGIKDNIPGKLDSYFVTGNTVILKASDSEYLLFAHLKQSSVAVQQGQKVKRGQKLGLCGNSGHSSAPHLHFHIQNTEDLNSAIGIKCYFENIKVNGTQQKEYSPIKNDTVENLKK